MAKSKQDQLVEMLHATGIRKKSAKVIAQATDGRRKPARQAKAVLNEMTKVLGDVEDRVSGTSAKRSAAGKKGAATRKKNAAKRSAAAKKGAVTRKRNATA